MGKILYANEECDFVEVDIIHKDVWCRFEGEDEEQNTYITLSENEAVRADTDSIAFKCVNYLQFESKRWSQLDFSRYPLKVIFGYTCEINGSIDHWGSHVFEGYTTSTPYYDGEGLIMMEEETHGKGYVAPSDELIARAKELGWLWCPDEEVFEDDFYKSMDVEGLGGSVYLSDGVYINRTTIPLKDIEKVLDECDVLNES